MLEDAKKRNVAIDENVTSIALAEIERLKSERDLRFELDNLDVGNCNNEQVANLAKLR